MARTRRITVEFPVREHRAWSCIELRLPADKPLLWKIFRVLFFYWRPHRIFAAQRRLLAGPRSLERVEVHLPDDVPVHQLLPSVLRHAGGRPDGPTPDIDPTWHRDLQGGPLHTVRGSRRGREALYPIDVDATLARLGLADGAMIRISDDLRDFLLDYPTGGPDRSCRLDVQLDAERPLARVLPEALRGLRTMESVPPPSFVPSSPDETAAPDWTLSVEIAAGRSTFDLSGPRLERSLNELRIPTGAVLILRPCR